MPAVKHDCTVLVANYHAPEEKNIESNIEILKKFGVSNILLQTDSFDPELYFKLLSITSVAELERMPQYKSSDSIKQTSQLLTYPVLMTHDIIGYQHVFVGEDQRPHIDFARKLIRRYDKQACIPVPVVTKVKIKDLNDGSKKMSKSNPSGCIFLDDTKESIYHKIKKSVTDASGLENLSNLYEYFVGEPLPSSYGNAKDRLSEAISLRLNLG